MNVGSFPTHKRVTPNPLIPQFGQLAEHPSKIRAGAIRELCPGVKVHRRAQDRAQAVLQLRGIGGFHPRHHMLF